MSNLHSLQEGTDRLQEIEGLARQETVFKTSLLPFVSLFVLCQLFSLDTTLGALGSKDELEVG